ncbi:hypothetical protein DL96DRAFT_1615267, partial [Flagelloscypha sp. PMI_526]
MTATGTSTTPTFPPEIWEQIYGYVVTYADSPDSISALLLIDKLAYTCLKPCLCETANIYDANRGWTVRYILNSHTGAIPVRRVHVPYRAAQTVGPKLVLVSCRESIERLAYWSPPDPLTIASIRQLSRLTFLEIKMGGLYNVLWNSNPPPIWLASLTRLSLVCETYASVANIIASLDLMAFSSLAQMSLSSTQCAMVLAAILAKPPPILSLIVVSAPMGYERWRGEGTSHDPRVVYYERSRRSEAIRKIDEFLGERPANDSGFDDPLDDWGELTYCRDLHYWKWAERAQREGRKTFSRPPLTQLM